MNKLFLLSFLIFFFSHSSFAQTNNYDLVSVDESFLLLINDSLLLEKDFKEEKKGWLTKLYKLNGQEIKARDIKFSGFGGKMYGYSHYRGLGTTNSPRLTVRKEIGRIDIYQERSAPTGVDKSLFYSKKFEGVKSLNYKNLKIDLLSDTGAEYKQRNDLMLSYLEKAKRKRITSLAMLGIGLTTFMIGASGYDKNESASNLGVSIAGMGIMVGGIAIKHRKHYVEAIRAYNRF